MKETAIAKKKPIMQSNSIKWLSCGNSEVKDSNCTKKKGPKLEDENEQGTSSVAKDEKKKPTKDENKLLFQRLWSEDDEIVILNCMINYNAKKKKGKIHLQL